MAMVMATPWTYNDSPTTSRAQYGQSSFASNFQIPSLLPAYWPWETVKIGQLTVSPMGLGTWAWGNQLLWGYQESMDDELQAVFNLAVENGINLFDTADSYGTGKLNGRSEFLLGKFIREFPGPERVRKNIKIATKFAAYPWRLSSWQFEEACKSSLRRLQLEQLGIGQLHWSTANYAPLQELALWNGLIAMYEKGLVQAIGVSNYGPQQLLKIHDYLKVRGVPLSSAQVQFSLLSMDKDQMELKALCDKLGIQLISYSPLGLGMLTGKYSTSRLPQGPRRFLFRQILPGLEPLLKSITEIANKRGKTVSQVHMQGIVERSWIASEGRTGGSRGRGEHRAGRSNNRGCSGIRWAIRGLLKEVAINWCICKGTIPIPGVKNIQQARENLGALGWRLSSDEILQLEYAAQESPRKMIQNIFQTR